MKGKWSLRKGRKGERLTTQGQEHLKIRNLSEVSTSLDIKILEYIFANFAF